MRRDITIMRKLASIQRVVDVQRHPNADKLDIIRVLGWNLVAKRDQFNVGDLCCYIELDSVLPEKPEFEFLRARSFRVKTIRLRGTISQGIAFSLNEVLPVGGFVEGDDVTELIGVKKYVHPLELTTGGDAIGNFPHFIPQTDETRIQSVPTVLERHRGLTFALTEKMEGCSSTYAVYNNEFYVCGRTQRLADKPNSLYWHVAHKLEIEKRLRAEGFNVAIQGEIVGPKVQGNWYELAELDLRVFNYFDIDKYQYANCRDLATLVNNRLGLKTVPHVGDIVLDHSVDQLVTLATIKSTVKPDKWAEGCVFRPVEEQRDIELGRLSFKVINPEYLLTKHD